MNECLVTKLKAIVNDPNLPILEIMQQFTLAAIAASGNSLMTDAQKWALNHFFYQVGAIHNNSPWQKIKGVYLPVICGDNVSTAMNDYVDNTVIAAPSGASFSNHGLIADVAEGKNYNGSNKSLSIISVFSNTELPSDSNTSIGVRNTPLGGLMQMGSIEIGGFAISIQSQSARFERETHGATAAFVIAGTSDVLTGVNIDGVYKKRINARTFEEATLNNTMMFTSRSYAPVSVFVVGSGLTEDEAKTVMNAGIELKNAFVTN